MDKNLRFIKRLILADYDIDEMLKQRFSDQVEYFVNKKACEFAKEIKLKCLARDFSRDLIRVSKREDLITDEDVTVEDQKIFLKLALEFVKDNFNPKDEKALDVIRKWSATVEKIFGSKEKFKHEFGFSLLDKMDNLVREVDPSVWDNHINSSLYASNQQTHKIGCNKDWKLILAHERIGKIYKCSCGIIK